MAAGHVHNKMAEGTVKSQLQWWQDELEPKSSDRLLDLRARLDRVLAVMKPRSGLEHRTTGGEEEAFRCDAGRGMRQSAEEEALRRGRDASGSCVTWANSYPG